VAAVLAAARRDPAIRTVLAETVLANTASQKALCTNGFKRAGTRVDPAEGELVLWRASLAAGPA
jgi:RimJ/RimL family protein N-acetyltransferase